MWKRECLERRWATLRGELPALEARAAAGDADAAGRLFAMYVLGVGVARDEAQASRWCRVAIALGQEPALLRVIRGAPDDTADAPAAGDQEALALWRGVL